MGTRDIIKKLKIPAFQSKTDLDEYLTSAENVEIDMFLKDFGGSESERSEYFNYLYFQLGIILANLDKPTIVVQYLMSLYPGITIDEKIDMSFLLENLHVLLTYSPFYHDPEYKIKINIIIDMIDDEHYKILEEIAPEIYGDGVDRNLRRMLSYARTNEDPQKVIAHILSIKAGVQRNAVSYGDSPEIKKTIELLNKELRRLGWVHNIQNLSGTEEAGIAHGNPGSMEPQTEKTPDHSDLLKALSKYITDISETEFTNIIERHSMTPGMQMALWIGRPADAHRFATYIGMSVATFNKHIKLICGRKLRANDKNDTWAPIKGILEENLGK